MTTQASDGRGRIPWRIIGWGIAALLLLLPLIANAPWTGSDFAFAAVMIGGVGGAFELAVGKSRNIAYRAGVAAALAGGLLLIWINGAVGIIGDEGNPANLMFLGVVGVEVVGAIVAMARPDGMVRALAVTAVAQTLVAAIALIGGLGAAEPPGRLGILAINAVFVALFLGSAWLFRKAAREQA